MRQKRAKAYRKLMHLYTMTFGFRLPYQILIDAEMCKTAISHKVDLVKQIGTVLQGEIKPMITQCCIHELYIQGKTQQAAVDLAKTFERRKCNHREPIPGDDCLAGVVGDKNKHRYVIATQSQPLRVKLRGIPAAPIVHINRSVMVLEPPSDATLQTKARAEEQALHASASDLAMVGSSNTDAPLAKVRKGPKAPNPLSVKKKKTPQINNTIESDKKVLRKAPTQPIHITQDTKKRKREHEDNMSETGDMRSESKSNREGEVKHKRKRRRKAKTVELLPES